MPIARAHACLLLAAAVASASLIPSTSASATVAPDAARFLAQVRAANPGWDRVDALVVESTIRSSGLDGRHVETVDVRDGRFDRQATFRPFAQRAVWNGHVFWRQDNSGGVHRLDGAFAMRHHATDAWMVRRGWLRADALGAYIGPVAMRSEAGHEYAVIEAVPSGGQAIELWFDPSTLDLVRTERVMPTSVVQTRYSDYRVVDGLRIPFTTEADEHDDNVETIHVTRVDPHARLTHDTFEQPAMPNDWSFADGPTTVPIDFRNGVLTIAATVNGKSYRFIFDTGGHSIVSPEVAKELGLDAAGAGQSGGAGEGTLSEQYTRIAKVDVGGLTLKDQHFYVLPLGYATFERGTEQPIAGLLGLRSPRTRRGPHRLSREDDDLQSLRRAALRSEGGRHAAHVR